MRKRAVSLILCLCMIILLLPVPILASGTHPFADVSATDWFNNSVQYVYDHNLMNGTTERTFSPNDMISRGMITAILYRMEQSPLVTRLCPFRDVESGKYYEAAIIWSLSHGIITGYDALTFKPDEPIKRQQLIAILRRYAVYKGYDVAVGESLAQYEDNHSIDVYARIAMSWAVRKGLLSDAMDGRHLRPQEYLSRAYASAILTRFCQNVVPTGKMETLSRTESASYTVTFELNYDGSGVYQTAIIQNGDKVTQPRNPSRDKYTFVGWSTSPDKFTKFNFNSAISENVTLYARWAKKSSSSSSSSSSNSGVIHAIVTTYAVTFNSNGGSAVPSQTVTAGNTVVRPTNPEKEGYRFDGWYSDSALTVPFDFNTSLVKNTTLYARWDIYEEEETIIYSKSLKEEHIAEGELSYEGETVSTLYVDNEILLEAKDGVTKEQIERLVGEYGGIVVGEIPIIGHYQIELRNAPSLDDLNGILSALSDSPLLESASPNPVMELEFNSDIFTLYYPTDPWEGASWNEGWPDDTNWGLEAINVPSAWRILMNRYGVTDYEAANGDFSKIPKLNIGIIDSLFDTEHPDLRFDHIYEVRDNADSPPRNTRDLALRETEPKKYDDYSHGTHVAGTIAAVHNHKGISGISLNHSLSVVSCIRDTYIEDKFSLSGNKYHFTLNDFQSALGALICGNPQENAPRKVVINFSMGNGNFHPIIEAGLTHDLKGYVEKGYDFLIVVAAGNYLDKDTTEMSTFAAIDDPDVASRIIVVGAAQTAGESFYIISRSPKEEGTPEINWCYGSRIDVAAPGDKILSTVPPSGHFGAKEYQEKRGTSMAAPHVTGTAALVWEANTNLSGKQVKDILINTADIELSNVAGTGRYGIATNNGKTYPRFMINAAHAVAEALGESYVIKGVCGADGSNLTWTFSPNIHTLNISGSGKMKDFEDGQTDLPWYRYKNQIREVKIADNVASIGAYAFSNFEELRSVVWGSGIVQIGESAFYNCVKLASIPDFPEGLETIGNFAFFNSALKDYVFTGFSALNGVKVTEATADASFSYGTDFRHGDGDTASVIIHYPSYNENWQKAVQNNGDGTYTWKGYKAIPYGTATLSGVVWEKGLTAPISGVTVDCVPSNDGSPSIQHTARFTATDGSFKFENLKEGTYTVTFHKSGYQDVTRTLQLESGKDVLWNAIQMEVEVEQPKTVTLRGTVTDEDSKAPVAGAAILISQNGTEVREATSDADGSFFISLAPGSYTVTAVRDGYENWQGTVNVTGDGQTLTVSLTKVKNDEPQMDWKFDETTKTLTITGSGAMPDYLMSERIAPWRSLSRRILHIEINGVTSIGNYAFYDLDVSSVKISGSVTAIGNHAFSNCQYLTSVTIPDSVVTIGDYAFSGCIYSLTSVTIPDSVNFMGKGVFYHCERLTTVTLSSRLSSIEAYAFKYCEKLTSVTIPDSVISIEDEAFASCYELASVTIPDGLTSIGWAAFRYCKQLQTIEIPGSVTFLGEQAFSGCTSLTTVILHSGITSIPRLCFPDCSERTTLTIPISVTYIGAGAFGKLPSIFYEGTERQWRSIRWGYEYPYTPYGSDPYSANTVYFQQ